MSEATIADSPFVILAAAPLLPLAIPLLVVGAAYVLNETQAARQAEMNARWEAERPAREAAARREQERLTREAQAFADGLAEKHTEAAQALWARQAKATEQKIDFSALPRSPHSPAGLEPAVLLKQYLDLYAQLEFVNPEALSEHKAHRDEVLQGAAGPRLELAVDALKLALGRELTAAARTALYKKELKTLAEACLPGVHGPKFRARLERLAQARVLTENILAPIREEFYALVLSAEKAAGTKASVEALVSKASEFLARQGYEVIEGGQIFEPGRPRYLATPNHDYRIEMVADGEGRLAFRQIKVVASEEEGRRPLTQGQKLVDKENGQAWCKAHDLMLEALRKDGFDLSVKRRIEPGTGRLPVLVDPRKGQGQKAGVQVLNQHEKTR